MNIFLRVPAEVSYELINNRAERSYTTKVRDEHEADIGHLKKSVATYDLLCQLFPKDFLAIECTKDNRLLSVPQISNLIWEKLLPRLPRERPHPGRAAVVTLDGNQPDANRPNPSQPDKLVHDFKNASLLLKLNIERQLKSVEPAGFNLWSDSDYKFYTPMGLPKELEKTYKAVMERLGELHKQMRQKLTAYCEKTLLGDSSNYAKPNISSLLLPVTPMAALCSFQATLSARAVTRISSALLSGDSAELQWAAKQLYMAARQKWPDDFKKPLESSSSPEPINNIIAKLAEERLSLNSSGSEQIKLLEASPRLEFDLLAESIYPYSNLSLDEITEEVSGWSYQQKYESLKQASADPSGLLEKIHYKFDLISDQIVMAEIANSSVISNLQVQPCSPRYGYEVPSIVEEAGIDDLFLECFDESLRLFSVLQNADREDLTVYATLLGHKVRWQFAADAQNMKLILDHKGDESYTKLADAIRERVSEVHPLTWEVINGPAAAQPSAKIRRNRVKASRQGSAKHRRSPRPEDR